MSPVSFQATEQQLKNAPGDSLWCAVILQHMRPGQFLN